MTNKTNLKKYDKHIYGIVIGIIAPLIVLYIVYYLRFMDKMSIEVFFYKIYKLNILPALLSLCAIVNLAIFFLFYKYWYNNAARGIIMATFLLAFIVLILKVDNL